MLEPTYEVINYETTPQQRQAAWDIGAGLQKIDGLTPTDKTQEIVAEYIAGSASYETVERKVENLYHGIVSQNKEADLSALRIANIVQNTPFILSTGQLRAIHGEIFDGLFADKSWVGHWRNGDIGKSEPVLGGKTVSYSAANLIAPTLDYDFAQEKQRALPSDKSEQVQHVLRFISGVWQVHPFWEGNTRSVACYTILYLRDLEINVNNEPFLDHSTYFRDALTLDNAPRALHNGEPLRRFGAALLDPTIKLDDLR